MIPSLLQGMNTSHVGSELVEREDGLGFEG